LASAIFAYAFLKAAYAEGVRNPLDVVIPLVKRALVRSRSTEIDQTSIQAEIRASLGIEIPLNVIRFTFPALAAEGILKLDNFIYKLSDSNYQDDSLRIIEDSSRAQLDRVRTKLNRIFIDNDFEAYTPDEFLEQWLDASALSFFASPNPAYAASARDREINRLVYLIIRDYDKDGKFLEDITEIVLGDSLFRAIRTITEYDVDDSAPLTSRMDGVSVYFDTRFVMRALGFGQDQLTQASRELVHLCKATGCSLGVFDHNVEEIRRVIRTVADRLVRGLPIDGDIASYASDHGFEPEDLIELAATIDEKIASVGFSISEAPPYEEALGIDEVGMERQLRTDLQQASGDAVVTDIRSLSSIYRLRQGEPKKSLEKCVAIFVTSNKGLADFSVRHFQKSFREEGELNTVQLCITDVVFSTRLWTKLPTKTIPLPRAQILSHIISSIRPSMRLRDSFSQHLAKWVSEGRIAEEVAAKMQLSKFVEQSLASEIVAGTSALSDQQFVSVARKVIQQQKDFQQRLTRSIKDGERARLQTEYDTAIESFNKAEQEVLAGAQAVSETTNRLLEEIRENERTIDSMGVVEGRVRQRLSGVVIWLSRAAFVIVIAWLGTLAAEWTGLTSALVGAGLLDEDAARRFGQAAELVAGLILAGLTWFGLSATGATSKLEDWVVRNILRMIFA
jgi:hypothetical protein